MRCLYCGKELALLKRLTGGGDFCSEAHKQSYQEEYNRLALSRLLQAQKKKQQSSTTPSEGQGTDASIAVQEPQVAQHDKALEAPVAHAVGGTATDEPVSDPVGNAEDTGIAVADTFPEPVKEAGFLLELPASAEIPDTKPYLDSWREISGEVTVSSSQIDNGSSELSPANLLSFEFTPNGSDVEYASSPDAVPEAFSGAPVHSSLSSLDAVLGSTKASGSSKTGAVSSATGLVSMDVPPIPSVLKPDYSFVLPVPTDLQAVVGDSSFLSLPPTGIDWTDDGSDVPIDGGHWNVGAPFAEQNEEHTPRTSLEALSRLHHELAGQEFGSRPELEVAEPEHRVVPTSTDTAVATIEVAPEEPKPQHPTISREIFEIPIKAFSPAKPALAGATALATATAPLLPQMRSLPLRPKIALATGYTPSTGAAVTGAPRPVAHPQAPAPKPPADTQSGPASPQPKQSKQPPPIPKPQQAPVTKPAESPKPVAAKAPSVQRSQEEAKPAAEIPKPVEEPPKSTGDSKPASLQKATEDAIPHFGVDQTTKPSWLSSLKLKLGLAIVLVAGASTYFLGWGGKAGKTAGSIAAVSADGSGPSIIMGEGGWVENWGGDPAGMHAGREITIYRPSLKLSDYRLQFQASIDTKSIGWVFRAADPSNYYAMKLMSVSSSLPMKVALFKYLVTNDRQTQVGRVPIDLPVAADTAFDIRVDVRGPQFTTYIQGQQVDIWTDDQLKIGGAGFLNERGERGKVKSVSIRYLSGVAK